MALGDRNRFVRVENDLSALLDMHGVAVQVTRTVKSDIQQRDIFGEPQNYAPLKFAVMVLLGDQSLDETPMIAGGRPKETISFLAAPGTLLENDEVVYGGHTYKIAHVGQVPAGGSKALEICEGTREVSI